MDEINWGSWSDFAQKALGATLQTKLQAQYVQPYEIQKMRLQAYGPFGDPYVEGQPGIQPVQPNIGGIPTGWLLLGGLVALVVVLAD